MNSPAVSNSLPPIWLTERDMQRLRDVVQKYSSSSLSEAAETLELELDRAKVVPEQDLPADVVTMRSRFSCKQLESGKIHEFELVYPHEANANNGKLSVLAPVGIATLGMRVGSKIHWPLPSGRSTELEVLSVLHQPEAAGELDP